MYFMDKLLHPTVFSLTFGLSVILLQIGNLNTISAQSILVEETSGAKSNDGVICNGASVTLTAPDGEDYFWSTGETTKSITVTPDVTVSYSVVFNNESSKNIMLTQLVTVDKTLPVSVLIEESAIKNDHSVTFKAIPVNGGTNPSYQWKVNDKNVGADKDVYTYNPSGGDIITVMLISNATCAVNSPATSNSITKK